MSRMYQPPGSPTSQIYYRQQRESSFSIPESPQTSFQQPMATDIGTGPQQSTLYTQPSSQQQHTQTPASNVDAFANSTNCTRSSASFHAGLNLASQISNVSLPAQRDTLTVGQSVPKVKSLSGKLGKVSKNVAKLALRVSGTSSAIETASVPMPTEAIVSFVDVVASLINRYARNSPGISRADVEAVFQSAPNAKYEEVIRALTMAQAQQQKASGTAPGLNIQVLIDELRRLQALSNVNVQPVQSQAYPSPDKMGVTEQSGPAFMNNASPPRPSRVLQPGLPDALLTHAPMTLTFSEHAITSSRSEIDRNSPHIDNISTSRPQFQSPSSLIDHSVPLPPYQMNASGTKLHRNSEGARDMLDDQDVSSNRESIPASLSAELMQQQAQLQMTLLQQYHQMTLLQQQQQHIMHILLEQQMQKQNVLKDVQGTLGADSSSPKAFIGGRPDSRNEVTSLPLPLT